MGAGGILWAVPHVCDTKSSWEQELATHYFGVCHGRIRSSSSMTHNRSLFRSLCTQRWTRACSLAPEARSFWLAFQARPALCMHVFVKVQCSTLGSALEDKCFSPFLVQTDVGSDGELIILTAFIAKQPGVAYTCSHVLLVTLISRKHLKRKIIWILKFESYWAGSDRS